MTYVWYHTLNRHQRLFLERRFRVALQSHSLPVTQNSNSPNQEKYRLRSSTIATKVRWGHSSPHSVVWSTHTSILMPLSSTSMKLWCNISPDVLRLSPQEILPGPLESGSLILSISQLAFLSLLMEKKWNLCWYSQPWRNFLLTHLNLSTNFIGRVSSKWMIGMNLYCAFYWLTITHSLNITGQETGWMTNDIFKDLVIKHFIPFVNEKRKKHGDKQALLVLDSHSSRACAETMKALSEAKIDCITIPAHTSHVVQPLDLTVNGMFKRFLNYTKANSKVISIYW